MKPEIYFTITFSSNKDPHKILERIGGEWAKVEGKNSLKEIASFSTKTAFTLFHAQNNNSYNTVLTEIKKILEEAREVVTVEPIDAYYEYTYRDIPQIERSIATMLLNRLRGLIAMMLLDRIQGFAGTNIA